VLLPRYASIVHIGAYANNSEYRRRIIGQSGQACRGARENIACQTRFGSSDRSRKCSTSRRIGGDGKESTQHSQEAPSVILVDTSVWIDHLRHGNKELREFLEHGEVL